MSVGAACGSSGEAGWLAGAVRPRETCCSSGGGVVMCPALADIPEQSMCVTLRQIRLGSSPDSVSPLQKHWPEVWHDPQDSLAAC